MTRAELRLQYNDLIAEVAGKKTWLTTQADRWLDRSYKRKQRQYGLYLKTKAVQILVSRNEYSQSEVIPPLNTGEIQGNLWSVQYQRGVNGLFTGITTENGNAKIASTVASSVVTGTRLQLLNMTSGNYMNGTYIGGAWDSSVFYVIDLAETVKGTITEVSEDSEGIAIFNLTSHPFNNDQIVRLSGGDVYTEALYTVHSATANSFELNDISGTGVVFSATDTPVITRVLKYDTSTDTGIFVNDSSYRRRTLTKTPWQELQSVHDRFIAPTSLEVPVGTAFLNWWVVSAGLESGELSDVRFPEPFQEHIAVDAAKNALISTGAKKLSEHIDAEWIFNEQALVKWSKQMNPREEAPAGKFYGINGLYAYRPQTDRAFIIAPRDF